MCDMVEKGFELYLPVPGYPDYQVSNLGNVKSYFKYKNGMLLSLTANNSGYYYIGLHNGNKTAHLGVHVIVARTFLGPPPTEKHEINHKNGIRNDNRAENLEWVTRSENLQHGNGKGWCYDSHGENHSQARLTDEQVLKIRALGKLRTGRELSRLFNVCPQHISDILNRKRRTNI